MKLDQLRMFGLQLSVSWLSVEFHAASSPEIMSWYVLKSEPAELTQVVGFHVLINGIQQWGGAV